jgi:hypothetical protein
MAKVGSCLASPEYHHVVFTLPAGLAALARQRPRLVYNLLFQAASAS